MDLQTSQQFSRGYRLWARYGAFLCFAVAAALMLAALSGLHAAPRDPANATHAPLPAVSNLGPQG